MKNSVRKVLVVFLAVIFVLPLAQNTAVAANKAEYGLVVCVDYWQTPNKLCILTEDSGLVWVKFTGETSQYSYGTIVIFTGNKMVEKAENPPDKLTVNYSGGIKYDWGELWVPEGLTLILDCPSYFREGGNVDVYGTLVINDIFYAERLNIKSGATLIINAKLSHGESILDGTNYSGILILEQGAHINGDYTIGLDVSLRGTFNYDLIHDWWIREPNWDTDEILGTPKAEFARNNVKLDTEKAKEYYLSPSRSDSQTYSYDNPEIINTAISITQDCKSDYEKVQSVHDWVANNIWYDADSYHLQLLNRFPGSYDGDWSREELEQYADGFTVDPIEVLAGRHTVCEGYAALTCDLLRASGIPARYVSGFSTAPLSALGHAWTEAYADGRWIVLDTTWDSFNVWENGQKSITKECRQEYFDIDYDTYPRAQDPCIAYTPSAGYEIDSGLLLNAGVWGDAVVPETAKCIGWRAIADNNQLKSVRVQSGVQEIRYGAFADCASLASVELPDTLKVLDLSAFKGCSALKRLVVPSSVIALSGTVESRLTLASSSTYVENYAKSNGILFEKNTGPAAKPTTSTVLLNGGKVAFDAYTINGNNYFKLRDLAYTLSGTKKQFNVGWDGANNAISLTSGKAYSIVGGEMSGKGSGTKTPTATTAKIYLDGKQVNLTAYTIDGNNYFKLRDIGEAFDFGVEWDGANNTIVIDISKSYTAE